MILLFAGNLQTDQLTRNEGVFKCSYLEQNCASYYTTKGMHVVKNKILKNKNPNKETIFWSDVSFL